MARFKLYIPLVLFAVLALFLFRGLQLDPQALPSALINKPLPAFDLPRLGSDENVTRDQVVGEVSLFNVWATWCVACRVEHPWLLRLAEQGVPVYGINYKDTDSQALAWLVELGDPYRLNIVDAQGELGLDLGVYGAPETYVVDPDGIIRYRHVGVIDERVWAEILQPVVDQLRTGSNQGSVASAVD